MRNQAIALGFCIYGAMDFDPPTISHRHVGLN
jgi:hypothetical protein